MLDKDRVKMRLLAQREIVAGPLSTPCWLWTGAKLRSGYGAITIDGRSWRVHRVAFILFRGPIPEGHEPDHLCRVKACFHPEHLEAVTRGVNMARAFSHHRHNRVKTHCPKGHEYTDENTHTESRGSRHCRKCKAEWSRNRCTGYRWGGDRRSQKFKVGHSVDTFEGKASGGNG